MVEARGCRVSCGFLGFLSVLGCFVGFGFSFVFLAFVFLLSVLVYTFSVLRGALGFFFFFFNMCLITY
jgi:hypothetical protein